MKYLGVILVAVCGVFTESFVNAGALGWMIYALLVAGGVALFCINGRADNG